mmetsp:Transcript_124631/g.216055  ORF Transcript_124631/g.216055 Transcript_124631/m.216055 type:complete len:110 (-) Transcript_124631:85-414(-)
MLRRQTILMGGSCAGKNITQSVPQGNYGTPQWTPSRQLERFSLQQLGVLCAGARSTDGAMPVWQGYRGYGTNTQQRRLGSVGRGDTRRASDGLAKTGVVKEAFLFCVCV